ncbi:uncharacterized protein [Euphorbia lathyris]|uniref:uncharacterized protein isoform X2 n=1 Tax=Euphorbia lathyris TaxID=212925 RepID=UPI0033131F9D
MESRVLLSSTERLAGFQSNRINKVTTLEILPCDHSVKDSPAGQKKVETEFSRLLNVAEQTSGLYFSYDTNITLSIIKRLESINTPISSVWWVIGFYWIVVGGQALLQVSPHLYWDFQGLFEHFRTKPKPIRAFPDYSGTVIALLGFIRDH